MNRKRYLTESVQDFGAQIVNNVYKTLLQWEYTQGEIDNIIGRDSIELDIENGECVLHCGNEIIYRTPSNVLIHKFAPAAEEALLNWCVEKIGREPEYIDSDDLFYDVDTDDLFSDVPGLNESKLNETKLKRIVSESIKRVLNEQWKDPYFDELLAKLVKNRQITIPQHLVYYFKEYASRKGIYPEGAGIYPNGLRVLFL